MATRGGKVNPVGSKACRSVPKMKIVRIGGQAKTIKGKMTRRGDPQR